MSNKVFTVTQLNEYIKYIFDKDYALSNISIQGEISNLKKHSSGHLYFTLKDSLSAMNCIMFKTQTDSLSFDLDDGLSAILNGHISSYAKTGQYQLYVDSIEPSGKGDLYLAFEQLKKKLSEEGLFDKNHKKQIPSRPEVVGVITSITGAAVRDIIQIAKRRNPNTQLILIPVLVQGDNAAKDIAKAIYLMNEWNKADTIIIGRGGGYIEDLWAFNEEIVARAIYDSEIPIISAVGHEIDYTIADFVADLRAPTPSAAAELAIPDLAVLKTIIDSLEDKLVNVLKDKLVKNTAKLKEVSAGLKFNEPLKEIQKLQRYIDKLKKELDKNVQLYLNRYRTTIVSSINKLEASSPLSILKKGYAISYKKDGQTITDIDDIDKGYIVVIQLNNGYAIAKVESKETGIWHA